jgi:hypothetical protein
MRKVDGLSLILIDFYVPSLTPCVSSTSAFGEHNPLCSLLRIYRCQQQRDLDRHQVLGAYHLYIYCTMWGTEQNLVAPLLVFPLA